MKFCITDLGITEVEATQVRESFQMFYSVVGELSPLKIKTLSRGIRCVQNGKTVRHESILLLSDDFHVHLSDVKIPDVKKPLLDCG